MMGWAMLNAPSYAAAPQAHAKSVAKGIIREMLALFGSPRVKSARGLILMLTGEPVSKRALLGIAGPLRYQNISKRAP